MLKDKKCKLKIFQKEKDLNMYKYFLPNTREYLFSSFSFSSSKLKKLEEMSIDTRAAILSKYKCNIFEYELSKDIQGKVDDPKSIYFSIRKLEVICFSTGIGFLCIKTNLDEYEKFSNILNFNYKFRDINQAASDYEGYDNIRIQTGSFDDVETFRGLIRGITGGNLEAMKIDVDTERFLTYSYVCIDSKYWDNNNKFEDIKLDFIKYASILPADNSRKYDDKIEIFSKWKYAKIGISKLGTTLFSSSTDINNYTILPSEYENQYFYTYIFNLYKKIYLKKIKYEFKQGINIKQTRKKFVDFTKNLWIQEITEDEAGTLLNHKYCKVFELEELYNEIKNKYDIMYKELKIEKNTKWMILSLIILVISLALNIISFLEVFIK